MSNFRIKELFNKYINSSKKDNMQPVLEGGVSYNIPNIKSAADKTANILKNNYQKGSTEFASDKAADAAMKSGNPYAMIIGAAVKQYNAHRAKNMNMAQNELEKSFNQSNNVANQMLNKTMSNVNDTNNFALNNKVADVTRVAQGMNSSTQNSYGSILDEYMNNLKQNGVQSWHW